MRSLVRQAPTATLTYIALLGATSLVLELAPAQTADRLLDALSTNLHQLGRVPLRVLVGSAFWVGGFGAFATWAILLGTVAAPVERRIGRRRVCGAFALGHVGATLLVAAGLFAGVQLGFLPDTVSRARDVGASYGFLAVAAVAVRLLPPPSRDVATATFAAALGFALWSAPSFTAVGHLLAFGIGLGYASHLEGSFPSCIDPLTQPSVALTHLLRPSLVVSGERRPHSSCSASRSYKGVGRCARSACSSRQSSPAAQPRRSWWRTRSVPGGTAPSRASRPGT